MPVNPTSGKAFLKRITEIVEENISKEHFGVSDLAKQLGMSRSNLHRKVNAELKISVSQFVNQVRLKRAKDILRHTSDTVSEVAYKVGYNNVSYFIKCFHNYYGYSPGQVGDREETEELSNSGEGKKQLRIIFIAATAVALLGVVLILFFKPLHFQQKRLENSIIMLPIDNWETNDSISIIGVLESIRDNLCKIRDIDMKPPVSVLLSSNSPNSNLEIAQKYKANYLIQPKTWKNPVKGNTYLSLGLIEVHGNTHIKTINHELNSDNITTIHQSFVKDIIKELDVKITQEEQTKIDKTITSNNKASKYYWEGVEIRNRWKLGLKSDSEKAISCFKNAIKHDNKFAHAYAQLALIYYSKDYHWSDYTVVNHEILYRKEISKYAAKAMLYNSELDLSLLAWALYFKNEKDYETAIDYFQAALENNPYSFAAMYHLLDLTSNDEEYIKYALKIIDSGFPEESADNEVSKAIIYRELGKRYRRLGFFDNALYYINEAIKLNHNEWFAHMIKAHIIFDKEEENSNQKSLDIIKSAIKKRANNIPSYGRLAQAYYNLRDYKSAYQVYAERMKISGKDFGDITGATLSRIAFVFREMGEHELSSLAINRYREFGESRDLRIKHYYLTGYYSFIGETNKAIEHLKLTSQHNHIYNSIVKLKTEPLYDNIREHPEFQEILSQMQDRWQARHDSIRVVFEEKGLLDLDLK